MIGNRIPSDAATGNKSAAGGNIPGQLEIAGLLVKLVHWRGSEVPGVPPDDIDGSRMGVGGHRGALRGGPAIGWGAKRSSGGHSLMPP